MLTDARQLDLNSDASTIKNVLGSNSTNKKQMRTTDRTTRKDDLSIGVHGALG